MIGLGIILLVMCVVAILMYMILIAVSEDRTLEDIEQMRYLRKLSDEKKNAKRRRGYECRPRDSQRGRQDKNEVQADGRQKNPS